MKSFCYHVDGYHVAIGGTLTQKKGKYNEYVIAYFSKLLSPAEKNYTENDRKLLGLIYFLKHFLCYLERREFVVLMGKRVLKSYFTRKDLSRREARWL